MSLKCPLSPAYLVNVFIECCARNVEDVAYKSESDRLSLIRRRNIYTSLVNNALKIKTFRTFIALHKIHRVELYVQTCLSLFCARRNYCHHTVVKMQHDATIVLGISPEYNWCYGHYIGSLNVLLLLCRIRCKEPWGASSPLCWFNNKKLCVLHVQSNTTIILMCGWPCIVIQCG